MEILLIVAGMVISALIGLAGGLHIDRFLKKHESPKSTMDSLPKCRCRDVNQCDTWCYAKEMFARHGG